MKRKSYYCGLEAAFDVIGGKWKVMILWNLRSGSQRFGELKRSVEGVTEKMLIQQLRDMEADGLVIRNAFPEIPPRVEYSISKIGVTLLTAMTPLCEWGTENINRITARRLIPDTAGN